MPREHPLAPDYYLGNFQFLVDWVWQAYSDLLNDEERTFITGFRQLGRDAQCLLVRLSSRKGPLFRRDKLAYGEITDLDAAAVELIAAGFIACDTLISLDIFAGALTKTELLALFREPLAGMKSARKEALIQQLQLHPQYQEPRPWQEWTRQQLGAAFYWDKQPIVSQLLLLFFGNAYQDLTEFVLQDLGLFRYENYVIDHEHRLFSSREELEQYRQLLQLREQLAADNSPAMLRDLAAQLPPHCASERITRRRAKLANQLAYALERAGEHSQALALYQQSHLPPARERRIRLLEKQGDFVAANALLQELLLAPLNEQELQIAQRMAPRLAKKMGITFTKPQSLGINEHQKLLASMMDVDGDAVRVEEVVRIALHTGETPCVYTENVLINGLFGLWLWPEMFRGVEGAFANPFQSAPLDIFQENFAQRRPGMEALWAQFESHAYRTHILHTWEEKYGISNIFVHWPLLSRDLLTLALDCIPGAHLKAIFTRLLFDIQNNRSGLPDLIQFEPAQCRYRLIEVKGPGDRLQDNQQRWLDYFAQQQIPAEVWYVRWQ